MDIDTFITTNNAANKKIAGITLSCSSFDYIESFTSANVFGNKC